MLLSLLFVTLIEPTYPGVIIKTPLRPFIVGGHAAPEGRYRFIADISYYGVHQCGGSLLTNRHVLTVKHCSLYSTLSRYSVTIGEYNNAYKDGTEQTFGVSHITSHPWDHIDIAIFVLKSQVSLSHTNARVIPLARELPPEDTLATAMGWGWTQHNVRSPSEVLQSLDLPIANTSHCNHSTHGLNIQDHEFCCGKNQDAYTNICHGDSGSPLVFPGNSSSDSDVIQIGVSARGRQGCLQEYVYAAFINVAYKYVFTWIVCVTLFVDKFVGATLVNDVSDITEGNCTIFYPNITIPQKKTTRNAIKSTVESTMSSEIPYSTTGKITFTSDTSEQKDDPEGTKSSSGLNTGTTLLDGGGGAKTREAITTYDDTLSDVSVNKPTTIYTAENVTAASEQTVAGIRFTSAPPYITITTSSMETTSSSSAVNKLVSSHSPENASGSQQTQGATKDTLPRHTTAPVTVRQTVTSSVNSPSLCTNRAFNSMTVVIPVISAFAGFLLGVLVTVIVGITRRSKTCLKAK